MEFGKRSVFGVTLLIAVVMVFAVQGAGESTPQSYYLSGKTTLGNFVVVYEIVIEMSESGDVTGSGYVEFYANGNMVFCASAEITTVMDETGLTNIQIDCVIKGKEVSFVIPGPIPISDIPPLYQR